MENIIITFPEGNKKKYNESVTLTIVDLQKQLISNPILLIGVLGSRVRN